MATLGGPGVRGQRSLNLVAVPPPTSIVDFRSDTVTRPTDEMRQAMANQLAMSLLTEPGDEILCDEWAHIRNYELGAASYFSTGRRDT